MLSYNDPKGIRALWTLRAENKKVVKEIKELKTNLFRITQKINEFKGNPAYQERMVRLQTGYLKQNEMLIEWL